jgi:Ca2+-binding RTX toxin-like protein
MLGVENLGPSPASAVTVTDSLPKDVRLVSATGPAGACAVQGGKVTCAIGALNPTGVNYGGAPASVTIVVAPERAGTIRNTATVTGDQKDPNAKNNKATVTTRVLGAPTCRGLTATISGTPGDDLLVGSPGPDVIAALGGNDQIVSQAGRDLVCAGSGSDFVGAGTAADRIFGGVGRDRLLGRGGPDLLEGSAGGDALKGGRGSDRLRGGRGFDRCLGGTGLDSISGCER